VVDGVRSPAIAAHRCHGTGFCLVDPDRATGVAVKGQSALAHRAAIGKQALKVLHYGVTREVADEKGHQLNRTDGSGSLKDLKKVAARLEINRGPKPMELAAWGRKP